MENGKPSSLEGDISLQRLKGFKRERAVNEIQEDCPLLCGALTGVLTRKKSQRDLMKRSKKRIESLKPVLGTIVAMVLFKRSPKRFKASSSSIVQCYGWQDVKGR